MHFLLLDVTIALHNSLALHFTGSVAPVLRSVSDNIDDILGPDIFVDISFTTFALNAESTYSKIENSVLPLDRLDPRPTCSFDVLTMTRQSSIRGDPLIVSSI